MDAIIIDNNASIIRRVSYIINLRGEIYGEISVLLFTSIIVWSHIHSNDFVLFVHRYFLYGPFFSFFCWSSRPGRYYTSINSENSLDYKNNSIILVHNNRTAVVLSFFYPTHTYFLIWTLLFLLLALSARSIQILILIVARCIDY